MSPRRGVKIPNCALIGVIASSDELRYAREMPADLPDFFELRLDHLPNLQESEIAKLPRPVIITARHPAEGGKKMRESRRKLLLKFLPQAEFVDVELRSLPELRKVWEEARGLKVKRICSVHELRRAPSLATLNKKLQRAQKSGADIFKFVSRAETSRELSILRRFLQSSRKIVRLCVMSTGKFGAVSRQLLPRYGSIFVYVALCRPLYEGQPTLEEFRSRSNFYATK